jgi:hypothetical protein
MSSTGLSYLSLVWARFRVFPNCVSLSEPQKAVKVCYSWYLEIGSKLIAMFQLHTMWGDETQWRVDCMEVLDPQHLIMQATLSSSILLLVWSISKPNIKSIKKGQLRGFSVCPTRPNHWTIYSNFDGPAMEFKLHKRSWWQSTVKNQKWRGNLYFDFWSIRFRVLSLVVISQACFSILTISFFNFLTTHALLKIIDKFSFQSYKFLLF